MIFNQENTRCYENRNTVPMTAAGCEVIWWPDDKSQRLTFGMFAHQRQPHEFLKRICTPPPPPSVPTQSTSYISDLSQRFSRLLFGS